MTSTVFERISRATSSATISPLDVLLQDYDRDTGPLTFATLYELFEVYAGGTGNMASRVWRRARGLQWGATYPETVAAALKSFSESSVSSTTESKRIAMLLFHVEKYLPESVTFDAMPARSSLKRIYDITQRRLPRGPWNEADPVLDVEIFNRVPGFAALPVLVLKNIYRYLKPEAVAHRSLPELPGMAYVSRRFFSMATGHNGMLRVLLGAVVRGEKGRVEGIIKTHPQLLLQRGSAKTFAGKTLENYTPWQMALVEWDVQINKGHPEMAEILCDALVKHYGHEALQEQVVELFERLGVKDHAELIAQQKASAEETRDKITALVETIRISAPAELQAVLNCSEKTPSADNELWQALESFRGWFARRANGEETAYNPYHILVAYEVYADIIYTPNSKDRSELFWRQVVGWVHCFASASTAQTLVSRLAYVIHQDKPLRRSLQFQGCRSSRFIFPVSLWQDGLGFEFAACYDPSFAWRWLGSLAEDCERFSTIMSNKNNAAANLLSRATNSSNKDISQCCST